MESKRILVVEDEAVVAEALAQRLRRLGYAVPVAVASGLDAIHQAVNLHPDLVLMDIHLKGAMDGVEAATQIHAQCDIPVVYLTAYADETTLARAKITEPFGYILKPFEEKELQVTIEIALYKHGMERKLKEREQWLATTLTSIGEAVLATDRHGCITLMNPAATALVGWSREDALGQQVAAICPLSDTTTPGSLENPVMTVLREGSVVRLADGVLHARPDIFTPVTASAAPLRDKKHEITGAVMVLQDITVHKQAEDALRQAKEDLEGKVAERTAELQIAKEQAESNDRFKSEFLAMMSHELRTPLNSIIGFTGVVLMKLPGPLTVEQERHLTNVKVSANHLLSLINDVLDVAKIEAGKVELTLEPVVCQSVTEEVATTLRPIAENKGLQLEVSVPPVAVVAYADQRALSQILLNLTNNAIKFTEQGMVRLALSQRHDRQQVVTEISVTDTGAGIRLEDQAKLFAPFVQIAGARQRAKGTGLGLYLSQKLAELLGGQITLQSEYGKGSRFTLVLNARS